MAVLHAELHAVRQMVNESKYNMETVRIMAPQSRGFTLPYLQRWRLRRFLTQAELIEHTGLSRATIVRAERGDQVVSVANIKKLADALGLTPDELVYRDPDHLDHGTRQS